MTSATWVIKTTKEQENKRAVASGIQTGNQQARSHGITRQDHTELPGRHKDNWQ